jgi:peroxiredoxin
VPFARAVAVVSVVSGLALNLVPMPWLAQAQDSSQPPRSADASKAQQFAPDFTRTDLQGHSVRLSNYRGKVVLLTFWASWCEPCRAEAPRFSAWEKQYRARGLRILGVSMDDNAAAAASFAGTLKLIYPSVMGDAQLGQLYGGVMGLPLAFLIDPHGRIVARYRGEPDMDRLKRDIEELLDATRS